MPTSYENHLKRENLLLRLAAVAREAGAWPAAAMDLAARLADDHKAEVRPDGTIRLASGGRVGDVLESYRTTHENYFAKPEPAPAPEPVAMPKAGRRKGSAESKLARANGDPAPRLNASADDD